MAVRREELCERPGARVYVFPGATQRRRVRRLRMRARRRRAALAAVAVAVVLMSLLGGGSSVASRPGTPRAVTVTAGGTLWDLARRYAPAGVDRRAYVDAVIELNGLDGMPRAGEMLRLPR